MRMTFGRGFDSRHLHQFKALIFQGFILFHSFINQYYVVYLKIILGGI
jgi:hypothetical protein